MRIFYCICFLVFFVPLSSCTEPAPRYDLVIVGGQVIDGSGADIFSANIGIKDGTIIALGEVDESDAVRVIDAKGLMVAPGFIDLHSHAERDILAMPLLQNKIFQGVTTIVGGNCGGSPLDIGEFVASAQRQGMGPNMALLVGHNTVRRAVMGDEDRQPSAEELSAMQELIAKAMTDGASGMSTGLEYVPGIYANTDEIVALADIVARHGGFYASHMREEGRELMASMTETIAIGERAKLPVQISHHKVSSSSAWGNSRLSLAAVDEARSRGIDVTVDQYPYAASSTGLTILFPGWSKAGGSEAIKARLKDPETRAKIKAAVIQNINEDRGGEPWRIVVARFEPDPSLNGKNLAEITELRGREATVENAAEMVLEMVEEGGGSGVFHSMHEDDVQRIMQHPYVSIATDGHGVEMGDAMPHPRNYGTYPRVLGRYVREQGVISLEEAVRKMTSLPASRLGLKDRGKIAMGMRADMVIFDSETVIDRAEFADPHQHPEGMPYVIVNGIPVVDKGASTDALPGEFIPGPGKLEH